ncbi:MULTISPECIES: Fic family protein [unclassified Wenzhouxiangella]|uniref:Fic family protein n=1 Tax=unclassified Wenzhouxiangella TaxID=2613841 RepID=UPI000E32A703|nr:MULTISPECIES: Fic family protein [unclassified Wenzhouxiangella]RFF26706.1 Fic family protein [Wenzhouxiangella sp. 15181]RFP69325.1 Fic family protein [Wenzhouxiangella sp. 15190]
MKSFKAGSWVRQGSYRSFQPTLINRQWSLDDMEIQALLSQADRQLGRLDMFSECVPNIELFIRMHVFKEATQSSRIEGTQTRMDEALLEREEVSAERRNDWEEVRNYVTAMDEAIAAMESLPISSRLICLSHRVLMKGVRGHHKQPGEFRTSQNWIGGATIRDAIFVPPVHTSIPELMSDLEQFIHNEDIHLPELLRIALVHYQFETIHPFLDGNGRVGRMLIPLYLVSKSILKRPVLYLSDFLESHRTHYYDNLMRVREKDDIAQWFKFFLVGIIETAKSGVDTFDAILQLKREVDEQAQSLGSRAAHATRLLDTLYQNPFIDADGVSRACNISMPTAYKLLADLEGLGTLSEITGNRRNRKYLFERYLRLFQ